VGTTGALKRISCIDLALGHTCDKIFEADTDDEVVEQALAHAREAHSADGPDESELRAAIAGLGRPAAAN
jgi:predicted small metal-binding protein